MNNNMAEIHPIDKLIGKEIKNLRIKQNLTQKDVSDKLGIPYQKILRIEKGQGIKIPQLYEIAKILSVSIHDIIDLALIANFVNDIKNIEK